MKEYTVTFSYGAMGREKKDFTVIVSAYNKEEALLRAGSKFHSQTDQQMPDTVTGLTVTSRSRNGWQR